MGDARVLFQSRMNMNFNPFRSASSTLGTTTTSSSPQTTSPRSQPLQHSLPSSQQHCPNPNHDTVGHGYNNGNGGNAGYYNGGQNDDSRPVAPLSAPLAWLSGWTSSSSGALAPATANYSTARSNINYGSSSSHTTTVTPPTTTTTTTTTTATTTTTKTTTIPSPTRTPLPPPPIMHSISQTTTPTTSSLHTSNHDNNYYYDINPSSTAIPPLIINPPPIPTSFTMLRGTESHESEDDDYQRNNNSSYYYNNNSNSNNMHREGEHREGGDEGSSTMPSITSMMSTVILGPEKAMMISNRQQQEQKQLQLQRGNDIRGGAVGGGTGGAGGAGASAGLPPPPPPAMTMMTSRSIPAHSNYNDVQTRQFQQSTRQQGSSANQTHHHSDSTQVSSPSPSVRSHSQQNQQTHNDHHTQQIHNSTTSPKKQRRRPHHHHNKETNETFPGFALFEMAKVHYYLGRYSKALDTTTECLAFQKLALEMEGGGAGSARGGSNTTTTTAAGRTAGSGNSPGRTSPKNFYKGSGNTTMMMVSNNPSANLAATHNSNASNSNSIGGLGGANANVTTTIGSSDTIITRDRFGSSVRNLGMGMMRSLKGGSVSSSMTGSITSSVGVGNSITSAGVGGVGSGGGSGPGDSFSMASRAPLPSVTIGNNASDIQINHPSPTSMMANTTTMMISHYPTHSCVAQTLLLRGRVLAECGLYGCDDDDDDSGGGSDFLLLLQAIRHVEMAVAIQRRITIESNDDEDISRWKLATPLVFLGIMRAQLANFEEADMAYEEALSILKSVRRSEKREHFEANEEGDEEMAKECESCIKQIDTEIAHVLSLLGRSHHCRKRYDKAFDCYNEGLHLHKKFGSTKKSGGVKGIRRCMKDKGALEKLVSSYWDDRRTI